MIPIRDEFLSEEDLDLRNLSAEELVAYWNQWLEQAQATNAVDADSYAHGVFQRVPAAARPPPRPGASPSRADRSRPAS